MQVAVCLSVGASKNQPGVGVFRLRRRWPHQPRPGRAPGLVRHRQVWDHGCSPPVACIPVLGFCFKPAATRQARTAFVLLICGLLGSCGWGPAQQVSDEGKARCESRAQREGGVIKRWYTYNRCLDTIEQRLAQERAAIARRQAAALAQRLAFCRRTRPRTSQLVAEFRRAQADLDQLRSEVYRPTPKPQPPDPVALSKLPIYDQELDQERYAQAVQAWQTKEAARSGAWAAEHDRLLSGSEAQLAAVARDLRALNPALLSAGAAPRLDEQAVRRFADCRPEALR